MQTIFVSKPAKWAPGLASESDWQEWKDGKKSILNAPESPKLEFTPPLFRRRLSQISRMTVQVVHDAIENAGCGDIKQVFASFRGEIKREFEINREILEDGEILPASFANSVFNAPIASASIALGLKSGYTVVFPSKHCFVDAFLCACAPVLSGDEAAVLFVYADECIPEEYGNARDKNAQPLAFSFCLSAKNDGLSVPLELSEMKKELSPADFLKTVL